MKIGIIGYGVVGKAIEATVSKRYSVVKYDKFVSSDPFKSILSCDFVFISVPTPFDTHNNCVDDSAVLESLDMLEKNNFDKIVIIKSTIPPGNSKIYSNKFNLRFVFNPEFLRESTTPNEDFQNQHTVVIGTNDEETFVKVKDFYAGILNTDTKYYFLPFKSAEMVKYSQNMTLASRVAISNIVFDACNKFNVDYSSIKQIAFDSFDVLGPHMTEVPGPDGQRGFGGKCLPKDILGFNSVYNSKILESIIEYNNTLRDDIPKNEK